MITKRFTFGIIGYLFLALIALLLVAGCTSNSTPAKVATTAATPAPLPIATESPTPLPATTTPAPTSTYVPTIVVSLPSDITMSYPRDWEIEKPGTTALREYGKTTTNIANFFSPDITWLRNKDLPNPDRSQYTTVSIDVDTQTHSDEDQYFNLATVAVQKSIGTIEITRHEQLAMSRWVSGYKTYALEFVTKDMKRYYYFVNVDGRFMIITVKNPLPYSEEVVDMIGSIKITPATNKKSR